MARGLVKGFASKPRQAPSSQGESGKEASLDVTHAAAVVSKPGMRRRIFQEARQHLDAKKTSASSPKRELLKHAAESLTRSIREVRLVHEVTEQMLGFNSLSCGSAPRKDIAQVQRLLRDLEADPEAKYIDTRTLRHVLEDVKAALSVAQLNNKLQEAEHILSKVHELEALIEASESEEASANLAQAIDLARATTTSPSAAVTTGKDLEEHEPSASPPPFNKGRKSSQGEQAHQARRISTRTQLHEMLRTSVGWVRLPPPAQQRSESGDDETTEPGPRRRESWLQWWPEHCFSEGYSLHQREAFFERLPKDKLNPEEMDLRDAIISFLEEWKGEEMATLEDITEDPLVSECIRRALPECVALEEWVQRRQRLGRRAAPASRLMLERETTRRQEELILADLEPQCQRRRKFQRRDSTERRPSAVFGLNFSVSDTGHISGRVAGDDESICDLPWPGTSVVPEQKSFQWICEVGAGTRRMLPSVTSRASGMVLEEVMAWRFSHRYRSRRVEPVLQKMWKTFRAAKRPSTVPTCQCAWCRGKLNYDVTRGADI